MQNLVAKIFAISQNNAELSLRLKKVSVRFLWNPCFLEQVDINDEVDDNIEDKMINESITIKETCQVILDIDKYLDCLGKLSPGMSKYCHDIVMVISMLTNFMTVSENRQKVNHQVALTYRTSMSITF